MKKFIALAVMAVFASGALATEVYISNFNALGTTISSQIKAENEEKAKVCAAVIVDETLRLEKELSAYDPNSDISKLGKNAGKWIEVSPDTHEILSRAIEISSHTKGAMDPTVGTLVKLWKVDKPDHQIPSQTEIDQALKYVDWKQIGLKEERGKFYAKLGAHQEITVGAIGKGFIADKIAKKLRENSCNDVLVSLGGNIITLGTNAEGEPWYIGIQEPGLHQEEGTARGDYFAAIASDNESLVTSGDYEKFFMKDGKKYHHILDPRTGWPVPATLSSVTIINKNSAYADGMCTALFVMGWDKAKKYLADHPQIKGVLVDEGRKNIAVSDNIYYELSVSDNHFHIERIEPKEQEAINDVSQGK